MRIWLPMVLTALGVLALIPARARAGGISVDAGLTPPEDQWIIRTQMRHMRRKDDPLPMKRKMSTYAFPVVLAYGFRSDLTFMIRHMTMNQKMSMPATTTRDKGTGDLFILAKYKAYRVNTPKYTLGIAPTLGLELPTGDDAFTSDTWDLNTGLYISGRSGFWEMDFNIAYDWNGFADEDDDGVDPGDQLSLDWALTYKFSLEQNARVSLAPVLELTYKKIWPDQLDNHDVTNTGESVLYLSPGVQFIVGSFIMEALFQVPVWQHQKGSQLERSAGILIGTRFLF